LTGAIKGGDVNKREADLREKQKDFSTSSRMGAQEGFRRVDQWEEEGSPAGKRNWKEEQREG